MKTCEIASGAKVKLKAGCRLRFGGKVYIPEALGAGFLVGEKRNELRLSVCFPFIHAEISHLIPQHFLEVVDG